MKLTESQLRRIVKEEIDGMIHESVDASNDFNSRIASLINEMCDSILSGELKYADIDQSFFGPAAISRFRSANQKYQRSLKSPDEIAAIKSKTAATRKANKEEEARNAAYREEEKRREALYGVPPREPWNPMKPDPWDTVGLRGPDDPRHKWSNYR